MNRFLNAQKRRSRRSLRSLLLACAVCLPAPSLAQTYTQTEDVTYHDNLSTWILGQVATRTVDGVAVSATSFNATYALPETETSFGKLQQTLTWETAASVASGQRGTLKSVMDGNNRTTTLSSWKRGFPQTIVFADASSKSAVVSDPGWITSITDELGSKTCYAYDAMGRLNLITRPSEAASNTCDSSTWNATTLPFEKVSSSEFGIGAGHWRQTISTGNARTIRYFDALWRPLVTREYDFANEAATKRYQLFEYHPGGQLSFASYMGTTDALPTGTWAALAQDLSTGTSTEYDALGRTTSVSQDSENGPLTTLTQYLSGFRTRTINPKLIATTTTYQAFDEPSFDRPTSIAHPEGAYTHITRDTFGKPSRVRRSDNPNPNPSPAVGTWVDRSYAYNSNQELCRVVEPETGATLMGYDGAGNLAWSATGLPSGTACHATGLIAPIDAERVARTYDLRNRLTTVDYPSGTDDVITTYDADGAVNTVAAGIVTLDYDYNRRRLLTGERLIWNTNNWLTSHGYTANGHAATVTYRDGHQLSFAPNALGQATQAGTYATAAAYFPNGALKQFIYGNGIAHVLTQNARGLPETSVDEGVSTVLDDTYLYDENGNVEKIIDGLPGALGTREMLYDDLDRLLTVTAGSAQGGNAAFDYNVLDNITRLDQGTRTIRHQYDAQNRVGSVRNAAGTTLFTLGYDIRGNQGSRVTGGVTDTFTFNRANRLMASNIGGVGNTYRYDGTGRRMQHVQPSGSSFFQYGQSGQLLFSQDALNRYNHVYLSGSLVAKRLVPFATGPTTTRYQHTDALGSPVAETDELGAVTRERLTAYGEPADGGWSDGPGFTGHDMDSASKLVYMQQRYYDPATGRFLSVDPMPSDMRNGWNFNRYHYAADNPFRFTDPDGRATNPVNPNKHTIDDTDVRTNASNPAVGKYGMTRNGGKKEHKGTDVAASKGTALTAPVSGTVVATTTAADNLDGGNAIWVEATVGSETVKLGMAHLDSVNVAKGDLVTEGVTQLGTTGDTGNAQGLPVAEQHVHLSVTVNGARVDPQQYFRDNAPVAPFWPIGLPLQP